MRSRPKLSLRMYCYFVLSIRRCCIKDQSGIWKNFSYFQNILYSEFQPKESRIKVTDTEFLHMLYIVYIIYCLYLLYWVYWFHHICLSIYLSTFRPTHSLVITIFYSTQKHPYPSFLFISSSTHSPTSQQIILPLITFAL